MLATRSGIDASLTEDAVTVAPAAIMLKSSSVFIERLHTLSSCEFAPNSIAQNTLRNPARMLHWAVTSAEALGRLG
jgi:hypothetical protein